MRGWCGCGCGCCCVAIAVAAVGVIACVFVATVRPLLSQVVLKWMLKCEWRDILHLDTKVMFARACIRECVPPWGWEWERGWGALYVRCRTTLRGVLQCACGVSRYVVRGVRRSLRRCCPAHDVCAARPPATHRLLQRPGMLDGQGKEVKPHATFDSEPDRGKQLHVDRVF